ncbi:MAG TPA: O-succinylhomoserine sulfhydrylase [Nevskiales bacterium]|nr:O-succinylhomoserine sulfhydrylase [Nevskiales bacterium]
MSSTDDIPDWGFATLGIRAGLVPGAEGEHSAPIYATSSFVAASAAEAAARFSGQSKGNIYSRFTNPTVQAFERRLAALEGGEACVGTASGMAAILATCMSLLKSGDHIVASSGLFGPSISLFNNYLKPFGIDTRYVPLTDLDAWRAAITPKTKLLFLETPSNPLTDVADIAALAAIAREHDCLLVVDNCFCTPALQRPLALGAHIVIHSATKYIDGQGRCIGGAVVGDAQTVGEKVFGFLRTAGPSLSPFNAWVFLKGLETLDLRMKAHSANALRLAEWLAQQPAVARVFYPGLPDHPQHALARRQQSAFGGIVSFEIRGGREAAWRVIDATRMISITANLGDTRSTITHPATTTHSRITAEDRAAAGITEGLLRVAVGLENVEDIIADLERGLSAG